MSCFFFQAEDGIRDLVRSRGLGDVYKRQDNKEIAMLPPRALWVSIVIALVFSFVLIFQPAIAQTPDGSATVSGVVVDEVSGMPVAGATVQLWYYPRFLSEYLSATTKGDGSYDIEVTLLSLIHISETTRPY